MSSSSTDVMQVLANLEYASHLSGDRLLIRHDKIVNYCVQTEPYHEYDSFAGDPTYREFVIGPADGRPALVDFDQLSGEVESADFIPRRQAAHTLDRTVFESLADSSTASTHKPLLHPRVTAAVTVPPLPTRYVASRQWTHTPISASALLTHRPQLSPRNHASNTIDDNGNDDERRKRHGNVQCSPLADVAHTDRSHVRPLYSLASKRQLPSLRARGWSDMRCHDQPSPSPYSSPHSRSPLFTTPFSPLSHPTSPSTFPPSAKRSARVQVQSPRFQSAVRVRADHSQREREHLGPYRGGIGAITPLQRPSPRSHPNDSSIDSQVSLASSPSSVSSLAQIRNPPHHHRHLHPSPPPISSPRIMRIKGLKPGYASSSPCSSASAAAYDDDDDFSADTEALLRQCFADLPVMLHRIRIVTNEKEGMEHAYLEYTLTGDIPSRRIKRLVYERLYELQGDIPESRHLSELIARFGGSNAPHFPGLEHSTSLIDRRARLLANMVVDMSAEQKLATLMNPTPVLNSIAHRIKKANMEQAGKQKAIKIQAKDGDATNMHG